MIYRIVAVRDRAADTYAQPVFVTTVGGAIRAFEDEINRENENNALFRHPDDFDLYEIGAYDDQSAEIVSSKPKQIAIGKEMKRQK